jgi:hypothetical protein
VADRQRNFSTLNADEKSVFTRAVNRQQATSLLEWQIDKSKQNNESLPAA